MNSFRSYELTRKDRLFKNLQRMQQIKVCHKIIYLFLDIVNYLTEHKICIREGFIKSLLYGIVYSNLFIENYTNSNVDVFFIKISKLNITKHHRCVCT